MNNLLSGGHFEIEHHNALSTAIQWTLPHNNNTEFSFP